MCTGWKISGTVYKYTCMCMFVLFYSLYVCDSTVRVCIYVTVYTCTCMSVYSTIYVYILYDGVCDSILYLHVQYKSIKS